jgi:hypothetical protein
MVISEGQLELKGTGARHGSWESLTATTGVFRTFQMLYSIEVDIQMKCEMKL